MKTSISDVTSLHRRGDMLFDSKCFPERMGNNADIAYGGCVVSMCVNAAYQTVHNQSFSLYSFMGFYLGPTLNTGTVTLEVEDIRTTRSFCTRKVIAKQKVNKDRSSFIAIADFTIPGERGVEYHRIPRMVYSNFSTLTEYPIYLDLQAKAGKIPSNLLDNYHFRFHLLNRYFEQRMCPEGIGFQNLLGVNKKVVTTQEHLPITRKTTATWFKSRTPTNTEAESMAAVSFLLDGGLSYIPLTFSHSFIDEYDVVSTLDYSLRFHSSDFRADEWLLQEQTTDVGDRGKTFSCSRMFHQDGRLLATLHQTCILKPKVARLIRL